MIFQSLIEKISVKREINMAYRPNEFLIDAFKDRETLLATSLASHDIDQLKDLIDRFSNRTERLRDQIKFTTTWTQLYHV